MSLNPYSRSCFFFSISSFSRVERGFRTNLYSRSKPHYGTPSLGHGSAPIHRTHSKCTLFPGSVSVTEIQHGLSPIRILRLNRDIFIITSIGRKGRRTMFGFILVGVGAGASTMTRERRAQLAGLRTMRGRGREAIPTAAQRRRARKGVSRRPRPLAHRRQSLSARPIGRRLRLPRILEAVRLRLEPSDTDRFLSSVG